ncbi:acyl-CoA thioesterase [Candidatus Nitrosotenuis aquarius]|uniref:acyl-CoA thioesterase n=1 Tax=Candidatus Nitrosotenuis aquarius TaxID=1846278 RepID=UPI000C1EB1A7|nr:acyl-CoA thioesterase [Candidatus Nitrosotenuis aquarius]
MFPHDANPAGNVFGGEILKHIDIVAGIVAHRHSRKNAVTASIDRVDFLKPVYVGNALILNARLNAVRKSSMEIEVRVEAEDLIRGTKTLTGTALVTSVALDENGRPTQVPELVLKTKEERQRFVQGIKRMNQRIKEKKRNKAKN